MKWLLGQLSKPRTKANNRVYLISSQSCPHSDFYEHTHSQRDMLGPRMDMKEPVPRVREKARQTGRKTESLSVSQNDRQRQLAGQPASQPTRCVQYLSSVGGGENPHGPSTLLDVPEEPQGRHLVGFRGHVHVHKQSGKPPRRTVRRGRSMHMRTHTDNIQHTHVITQSQRL